MNKLLLVKITEKSNNGEKELYLHPVKDTYGNVYEYDSLTTKYFWTDNFDSVDSLIDLYKMETLESCPWIGLKIEKIVYNISEAVIMFDKELNK